MTAKEHQAAAAIQDREDARRRESAEITAADPDFWTPPARDGVSERLERAERDAMLAAVRRCIA